MSSSFAAGGPLRWLSGCYFFYFAILGALIPYLGLFFEHRGYNAAEIGFLMAIFMGTRIIAPNLWAMVADRNGLRAELVKLGSFTAAIGYLSFFYDGGFWYLVASLTFYTFFWNAILAQVEVLTLDTLGANAHRYGAIRSYGSVGYIIWVVITGWLVSQWGAEMVLWVGLALFSGLFVCSMPLPSSRQTNQDASAAVKSPLKFNRAIVLFLLSALLLQAGVGPFYGFFVLYLKKVGYSETMAGVFVAMGAVAEIFMFMLVPRLLKQFNLKLLLMFSMAMTAIRWCLVATMPDYLPALISSQILHAFTFGLVHAASIQFVHRNFSKEHASKGQALYASMSFGLGGALGNWISGHIWGDGSGAAYVWLFSALCSIAAMVAVYFIPTRACMVETANGS
ncbi:MFS transporter [Shewanella avicenniae]|uniref:MFS transporter n=1 Tax=Shewanella avicenniae TaxID=2814294 RepID=A0ABX7QVA2_9GAMM|nr:MFS transporter [Shewanella avicenniae]QSX35433.1 MFS transporter [Shewanella avicenniae]